MQINNREPEFATATVRSIESAFGPISASEKDKAISAGQIVGVNVFNSHVKIGSIISDPENEPCKFTARFTA